MEIEITLSYLKLAKKLVVFIGEKPQNEYKITNLETGSDHYPIQIPITLGNSTIKFEVRGYS